MDSHEPIAKGNGLGDIVLLISVIVMSVAFVVGMLGGLITLVAGLFRFWS